VANSRAALDLTPDREPAVWDEEVAAGCRDAPVDTAEAELLKRLAEENGWDERIRCTPYRCDWKTAGVSWSRMNE
jgi:hypothetical protein